MARKLPKNDDEWEGTPEDDFGAGKEEEEELDDDDEVRRYQKEIRALRRSSRTGTSTKRSMRKDGSRSRTISAAMSGRKRSSAPTTKTRSKHP